MTLCYTNIRTGRYIILSPALLLQMIAVCVCVCVAETENRHTDRRMLRGAINFCPFSFRRFSGDQDSRPRVTQPIRVLRISCFRRWSAWRHDREDHSGIAIILSNATQLPLPETWMSDYQRLGGSWEFAWLERKTNSRQLSTWTRNGSAEEAGSDLVKEVLI